MTISPILPFLLPSSLIPLNYLWFLIGPCSLLLLDFTLLGMCTHHCLNFQITVLFWRSLHWQELRGLWSILPLFIAFAEMIIAFIHGVSGDDYAYRFDIPPALLHYKCLESRDAIAVRFSESGAWS